MYWNVLCVTSCFRLTVIQRALAIIEVAETGHLRTGRSDALRHLTLYDMITDLICPFKLSNYDGVLFRCSCWLSLDGGLIYAFVTPVLLVVTVSASSYFMLAVFFAVSRKVDGFLKFAHRCKLYILSTAFKSYSFVYSRNSSQTVKYLHWTIQRESKKQSNTWKIKW